MFDVSSDITQNRLYLTLKGKLKENDLKALRGVVKNELENLKSGFDVISDISALHADSKIGMGDLAKLQKLLKQSGAIRIVRIIGNQISTNMLFEGISHEMGIISEISCSREEAEQILASGKPPRNTIVCEKM
jgi:hypothetical protein